MAQGEAEGRAQRHTASLQDHAAAQAALCAEMDVACEATRLDLETTMNPLSDATPAAAISASASTRVSPSPSPPVTGEA